MTEGKTQRRSKTFNSVPFDIFERTAKDLGITHAQLSEAIGYFRNSHTGWRHSGRMPKVAQLACECLKRRNNITDTESVIICKVPADKKTAFDSFVGALSINAYDVNK